MEDSPHKPIKLPCSPSVLDPNYFHSPKSSGLLPCKKRSETPEPAPWKIDFQKFSTLSSSNLCVLPSPDPTLWVNPPL